ncbi:hypothetical protein V4C53_04655 [Paraburkholderia azotifigens]|uniref:hypothetical protein n=1 Tax=Paraburkholderia azotifigens TaxID=2057004 RepID=UPI00317A3B98
MPTSIKGPAASPVRSTQTGQSSHTAASTSPVAGQKRKAPGGPLSGMPAAIRQKTSAKKDNGRQDSAAWQAEVKNMGAAGPGLPASAGGKKLTSLHDAGAALSRQEQTGQLIQHPEHRLDSPVSAFGKANAGNLFPKDAAQHAGDHSPSVSAVKGSNADETRILRGKNPQQVAGGFNVKENDVPTLQFHSKNFADKNGNHDLVKDSAAHSTFTSLREMHNAGESNTSKTAPRNMDELLDNTARAYSPYNAKGEHVTKPVDPNQPRFSSGPAQAGAHQGTMPGDVRQGKYDSKVDELAQQRRAEFAQENPLPRTNVFAPNKRGAELHRSEAGVAPLVGQQMMNMWHRENRSWTPDGPNPTLPPRAAGTHETRLPLGDRIAQRQNEAQKQWAALSPAQRDAQEAQVKANVQSPGKPADDAMDVDA